MKRVRKKSAVLLSLILSASMLAACGTSPSESGETAEPRTPEETGVKKEGFPIVDEPITMTMMSQDAGVADWSNMPVLQEAEKLTNIKFEYQLTPIDSFATKKNLVFASGDLPDVLYAADLTPAEQVTYGTQVLLFRLSLTLMEVMRRILRNCLMRIPTFANPSQHLMDIYTPSHSSTVLLSGIAAPCGITAKCWKR